jgi:hypothetical protein
LINVVLSVVDSVGEDVENLTHQPRRFVVKPVADILSTSLLFEDVVPDAVDDFDVGENPSKTILTT